MIADRTTLIALIITAIVNITLIAYLSNKKEKSQLKSIFICSMTLLIYWTVGLILQITISKPLDIDPIYFDYYIYISICGIPISVFFMGLIYANTRIEFKRIHLLLFVIPILSLLILWTNDNHHLFYEEYSTNISDTVYGPYMIVHNVYSYILLAIGIIYMLKVSIKNSGFFSRQSLLIVLGISVPVVVNVLGTFKVIPMSIYVTPITFTITIICCAIAILKFKFLGVTPIALQMIVDRISDGYLVLDDNYVITEFNKTFLKIFNLKTEDIRSKKMGIFLRDRNINREEAEKIFKLIKEAKLKRKTVSFEQYFADIKKYFKVEITVISSENNSLGTLFLLKDITQHKEDVETIKNNQDILMERERLAGLGQLIGGIAHNLKTPIMSIAGATQGLEDLIKEFEASIDDPDVNSQDYHDIANDMKEWIPKIRAYLEYMADIITTVKGQAVTSLSKETSENFTVAELVKRVDILMKHELKNAYVALEVLMSIDGNQLIEGSVNVLVQVINNMITNAIQAYNGEGERKIKLKITKDGGDVVFSITDHAGGLPKAVQDCIFKEMITTKGKNGTGLGLYMSYSNIRAHFGGDITYETEQGIGTTFNVIIPIKHIK